MAKQHLTAIIGADTRGFRRGMRSVKQIAVNTVQAVSAIGVAGVAAYATATKATANYLDNIGKTSKRTGIAVDELQRLQFAADLSGTSLADLEKGVKRMASVVEDMRNGLSTSKDVFASLGLTMADVDGKTPTQTLNLFMNALAGIDDAGRRAALAQDVFGRAGTQLLPMLSGGVDGFKALRRERERMGPLFTAQEVEQGEELNDSISRLGLTMKNTIAQIVVSTFPQMINQINAAADGIARFTASEGFQALKDETAEFADNVKEAFDQLFQLGELTPDTLVDGMKSINESFQELNASGVFRDLREVLGIIVGLVDKLGPILTDRLLPMLDPINAINDARGQLNNSAVTPQQLERAYAERQVRLQEQMSRDIQLLMKRVGVQ